MKRTTKKTCSRC